MACRICKSKDLINFQRLDRQGESLKLQKCKACGVIQQKTIYKMDYSNDFRVQENEKISPQQLFEREYNRLPSVLDYMKRKGKLKKEGVIVELGCGYGGMTKALQDRGYDAVGFDLGEGTVQVGKNNRANVFVGGIKEILDLKVKVDCIFSCHLIEHLHNPVSCLKDLKSCLSDKGIVVVETPNIHVRTDIQWQKAHPYYFDELSLENCFLEAGFKKKYLNNILFGIFESGWK